MTLKLLKISLINCDILNPKIWSKSLYDTAIFYLKPFAEKLNNNLV